MDLLVGLRSVQALVLCYFVLSADDGGLEVLGNFLASDTKLKKIVFSNCTFGSYQQSLGLPFFAAFRTNIPVRDLIVINSGPLSGVGCLGEMLQNNRNLKSLSFEQSTELNVKNALTTIGPALASHPTLVVLRFAYCNVRDEDLESLAESLAGNAVLRTLSLRGSLTSHEITCRGSDSRLMRQIKAIERLVDSTKLRTIDTRQMLFPTSAIVHGERELRTSDDWYGVGPLITYRFETTAAGERKRLTDSSLISHYRSDEIWNGVLARGCLDGSPLPLLSPRTEGMWRALHCSS